MKSSTAIAELPIFKTRAIRLPRQYLTKWTQVGRPAIAPLAGHVRFLSKADMPTYFIEAHSLKPGGRDQ
jgi:hypothetical protein